MGHKGPVLRPKCIGPRRARTQIQLIHSFINKIMVNYRCKWKQHLLNTDEQGTHSEFSVWENTVDWIETGEINVHEDCKSLEEFTRCYCCDDISSWIWTNLHTYWRKWMQSRQFLLCYRSIPTTFITLYLSNESLSCVVRTFTFISSLRLLPELFFSIVTGSRSLCQVTRKDVGRYGSRDSMTSVASKPIKYLHGAESFLKSW
jgi:hypothetical protein